MTTETVVLTPPEKKTLTPEQKAKMAAGRAAALAKKRGPSDIERQLAETNARLDVVMQALARMTAAPAHEAAPAPAPHALAARPALVPDAIIPPRAQVLGATRDVEAAYVVMTRVGPNRDRVNVRITDPEDERWDGMLMESPFNGDPRGSMEVATVTRVDGEIVKSVPIAGGPRHMNAARGFMRQFVAAKSASADKPWDLERWYRDKAEEEKRFKREGRLEELAAMRELLVAATRGALDLKGASA